MIEYVIFGIWWFVMIVFAGFFAVMAGAWVWDWYDRRRNRVMYELTRSHKPRRPAAK